MKLVTIGVSALRGSFLEKARVWEGWEQSLRSQTQLQSICLLFFNVGVFNDSEHRHSLNIQAAFIYPFSPLLDRLLSSVA